MKLCVIKYIQNIRYIYFIYDSVSYFMLRKSFTIFRSLVRCGGGFDPITSNKNLLKAKYSPDWIVDMSVIKLQWQNLPVQVLTLMFVRVPWQQHWFPRWSNLNVLLLIFPVTCKWPRPFPQIHSNDQLSGISEYNRNRKVIWKHKILTYHAYFVVVCFAQKLIQTENYILLIIL